MSYFTEVKLVDKTTGTAAEVDAEQQLRVVQCGLVDTGNSSSANLGAGATFTGTALNVVDYGIIFISTYSDVASATDGLCPQFSSDGLTNWRDAECYTVAAGTSKTFSIQPERCYFRIKYTNGATPQGAFDLQVTMKKTYAKPSSHRILDVVSGQDDAELMKSVITGEREDSTFGNARLDNSDRLQVMAKDSLSAIADGSVAGKTALYKFGTRTSVASATMSTVWEGPTALYAYMTTAQQLKVSSSSANDTAAGTGARTLTILGLDSNFDEIGETITMNGTATVTTALSYLRVYRAYVETSGSGATNAGTISILNNAATTTQATIPAGDGQTLMVMFTIPNGKKAFLVQLSSSSDSNKGARVSLFTRYNDGGILYPWRIRYREFIFSGGGNIYPFKIPLELQGRTDIEVRVLTPASAGTTSLGATFELWYEDE